MGQTSFGDRHEWDWDGWGFWDADARIAMLEETGEGIEVEGFCKWTAEDRRTRWAPHADVCVAVLEEIKVALKSSLERQVASLETDRWMFEGEGVKGLR